MERQGANEQHNKIFFNNMIIQICYGMINYKMKLIVTKNEPSKFDGGLVLNTHSSKLHLTKQKIIIGRGEQIEQQKSNLLHVLTANHKSISRRHASISIPYYLAKCRQQLVKNTMTTKANSLIPKFFFKLNAISRLPIDLLLIIRQYSSPQNILIITDLNSRFGLYQQINSIKFLNQSIEVKKTHNNYNDMHHRIINYPQQQKEKTVIQLGSQSIKIQEIQFNMQKSQIVQYKDQLSLKIPKIQYFTKDQPNPSEQSRYWSLLFRLMPLINQSENDSFFCLILSKEVSKSESVNKFSVGRHSYCDIQINKSSISRNQMSIYVDEQGNWVFQDKKSTNGTWLKSNKIKYDFSRLLNQELFSQNESFSSSIQIEDKPNSSVCNVIKLGEVKFEILLENIGTCWKQIVDEVKYGQTNVNEGYTRILADISGIESQSDDNILQNIQ